MEVSKIISISCFISAVIGHHPYTMMSSLSIICWSVGDGEITFKPEENEVMFVDNHNLDDKTYFSIVGYCSSNNVETCDGYNEIN